MAKKKNNQISETIEPFCGLKKFLENNIELLNNMLISVIMGVYNGEKDVARAIESILNQTHENFEFIIIDDRSEDNSYEIIKNYAKKDKRIKIFRNSKNIGLTKSLNKAILQSKGAFIARQDVDDVSLPKRLEIQLTFLESNKNFAFCGCNGIIKQTNKILLRFFDFNEIVKNLIKKNCFYHSTILFRNEFLKNYGMYNEKYLYSQDYELICRLIYKKKLKAENLTKKLMIISLPSEKLLEKTNRKFLVQRKNSILIKLKYLKYTNNKLIGLFSILNQIFQILYILVLGGLYRVFNFKNK